MNTELKDKTIFISIVGWNEPDILLTIESAISKSKYPNRLHFGVVDTRSDNNFTKLNNMPNVTQLKINSDMPLGVGFSRSSAISLINNEDYYFQIDAHMLFDNNWDEDIVYYFNEIKKDYNKPIITAYTRWYGMNNDKTTYLYDPDNDSEQPSLIPCNIDENQLTNKFILLTGQRVIFDDKNYKEHYFVSGHALFTDINFAFEVSPDPFIMFGGEEPTLALRAYTRGYRMFCIPKNIVWHKNKFYNEEYQNLNEWRSFHKTAEKDILLRYDIKHKKSLQRVKEISIGNILGYWGAKDFDSLKEYEANAEIDYNKFYERIKEL